MRELEKPLSFKIELLFGSFSKGRSSGMFVLPTCTQSERVTPYLYRFGRGIEVLLSFKNLKNGILSGRHLRIFSNI